MHFDIVKLKVHSNIDYSLEKLVFPSVNEIMSKCMKGMTNGT